VLSWFSVDDFMELRISIYNPTIPLRRLFLVDFSFVSKHLLCMGERLCYSILVVEHGIYSFERKWSVPPGGFQKFAACKQNAHVVADAGSRKKDCKIMMFKNVYVLGSLRTVLNGLAIDQNPSFSSARSYRGAFQKDAVSAFDFRF
jgi:hypothetical protein